jgi:hypothetical protein
MDVTSPIVHAFVTLSILILFSGRRVPSCWANRQVKQQTVNTQYPSMSNVLHVSAFIRRLLWGTNIKSIRQAISLYTEKYSVKGFLCM